MAAPFEKPLLTFASYNIHKCVGLDNVFAPERILEVIAELDADILALQETDRRFGERVGLLDPRQLKEKTGLSRIPSDTLSPLGLGWHGNALFYRAGKVKKITHIHLPGTEPRGALLVVLEIQGCCLCIVAAHLGLFRRDRIVQAKALLSLLKKHYPHLPSIILGDLNEWRMGANSSLAAFFPPFQPEKNCVPSFPARFPLLSLDRIFSFPDTLLVQLQPHSSVLSRVASDHLPIKAFLDMAQLRQFCQKPAQLRPSPTAES